MKQTNDSNVYFFIGNITSHILHALPLYSRIGGTFVVTSKRAEKELSSYNVSVICVDNIPHQWSWNGKRPIRNKEYISLNSRLEKTYKFLNENASVVIFYELFDILHPELLENPKKVFLTHGNMLKNYFKMYPKRLEIIKQYDYMASLGPFIKQEFIDCGIDEKMLVDIGIARTDEVYRMSGKTTVSEKLIKIGVPTDKQIVSYLPTFWGDTSVENLGPELLKNISKEYTVLFRPHPQTPQKVIDKYKDIVSNENVFYIPEKGDKSPSLLDVYASSDLIIGDMSSIMIEAVLLDKPLVFAETDSKSEIPTHNQLEDIVEYSNKITFNNVDRSNNIIGESLTSGIDKDIWVKTKDKCFFDHDGTSVEKIAEFIQSLFE